MGMEQRLDFRFDVPNPPEGPLTELSAKEMEQTLLRRVEDEKAQPSEALWQLVRFYQHSKQFEKALGTLRRVLALSPDPESKAGCVLAFGQMMESMGDFESAVRYYKEALALEPVQTPTWYFINNNLGFSLNKIGKFGEGEIYCRKAIEIDPGRPNAHKNLGISLEGQALYREAAQCFVTATQVNASDSRSLRLLQDLVRQHPELEYEFGELAEVCQKATEFAANRAAELRPTVYRGWRKHLVLLKMKLRSLFRFSRRCQSH